MAPEIVPTPSPIQRDRRGNYRDSLVGLPSVTSGHHVAFVAFSIMAAFPRRTPKWQELADRYGMNRATAYRYLASLKAVRGEL
ncbi:helix-turn-helix domain-containing protein [Luteimonas marina]|uniref:Helix-turn-helix domain-containing protein n=1 Tax=Luteimonas marina TaxID=488485 RepID=A0A5C5UCN3_9GAMM|nr:helix-turn-helix domain-containing protein [Luteimonas marina]TWT23597.1 helix-turn-helix domain-containing protein [Luteimonas marina]